MSTTVAIQYGIASGPLQGRRLRKALQQAGYAFIQDSSQADIIIAHSAGCFWLPTIPTTQRLLLVDPPYWPGKTTTERGWKHLRSHVHFRRNHYALGWWLWRTVSGSVYAIVGWKQTQKIIKTAQNFDLSIAIKQQNAILVRNEYDNWLTPDLGLLAQANPKLTIKVLPGEHEDIWYNPQPYVELLQLLV